MRMRQLSIVTILLSALFIIGCSMSNQNAPMEGASISPASDMTNDLSVKATATRPTFQMPFPSGQTWTGSTYTGHNPQLAVDLNRGSTAEADFGDTVVASFGGTVSTSTYSTTSGYGNYVVINHGGGWTTYYCHLNSRSVSAGQSVTKGQKIGTVGHSSALYNIASHLHYEQRLNGSCQYIRWNGSQITYWGKVSYTSHNSTATATGTVNTAGSPLSIRSGPGTGYSIVGSVADGGTVRIYSQAYGTSVSGTYGTTTIWDHIDGGYVSDAYVYTGSDGLVAPLE